MAKPQDKNEKKAKKNLNIDKLEERVAPAMFGAELTEAANTMDAADSADTSFDDTGSEDAGTATADGGYTGLEAQEPVDSAQDLGADEPALTDGGFEQSYAGFGEDYDLIGGGEAVTFGAPEGYAFDDAGTLEIPAGDTAEAGIAPWPEGTSIEADGTMTFDPPASFEVADDGVVAPSDPVDPVDIAPFIEDAQLSLDGENVVVEAPAAEGVSLDAGGETYAVPYEEMPPVDSAVPPIPGVSIEDGNLSFTPPEGVAYDADAGTYTFPEELAPPADAPNLPEGSFNDDGSWTVQAPEDADIADDGSFEMPLDELAVPDITLPSIEGLSMTGDVVSFDPPEGVSYDADAGSYSFPADVAPSPDDPYLPPGGEFAQDGSYTVPAPDGVDIAEDGSFNADIHELMDPAEQLPELEGLSVDGSTVSFEPPDGVSYDADAGNYTFPADVAPAQDDPYLPKEGTWNEDGSWTVPAPEGVAIAPDGSFAAEYQDLVDPYMYQAPPYPEGMYCDGDGVHLPVPDNLSFETAGDETTVKLDGPVEPFYAATACGCDCVVTADGSVQFDAGHTIQTDPEAGTYEIHQTQAPDATGYFPPGSEITADGGYRCELPDGYEVHDDGSVTLPVDPEFYTPPETPPDFTEMYAGWGEDFSVADDGSAATYGAPEGYEFADNGTLDIPADATAEAGIAPWPEGTSFEADGTLGFTPPETWEVTDAGVEAPADIIDPTYMAPFVEDATIAWEGDTAIVETPIPDGVSLDAGGETYAVQYDALPPIESALPPIAGISVEDGVLNYAPPEGVSYDAEAGTYTYPAELAPPADAPNLPEDAAFNEDGSWTVQAPEEADIADDGSFSMPLEDLAVPDIELPAIQGLDLNGDVISFTPPEGVSYDPAAGTYTFPAGLAPSPDDPYLPPEGTFGPDGSWSVPVPQEIDIAADGSFTADIHELMGPEDQLPEIDGLSVNGDIVNFAPPEGVSYDPAAGTYTFPADHAPNPDDPYLPKEGSFAPDGSWTVPAPEGLAINPDGSFQAPYQELVDPYMVQAPPYPDGMYCDPNGAHFPVPDNMQFNPDGGTIRFDGPVQPFYPATACGCDCNIQPDGGVLFQPPGPWQPDPEAGTYAMHHDYAPTCPGYFPPGSEIGPDGGYQYGPPKGYELHDDGSMTVPLGDEFFAPPEPFDAASLYGDHLTPAPDGDGYLFKVEGFDFADDGTLHIPAGELPEDFQVLPEGTTLDHDGNLAFQAPEGCTVGPDQVTWSPEAAPEPASLACWMDDATIQPNGDVLLPLPEDIKPLDDGSGYQIDPASYGPCPCDVPVLPGGEWTDTGYQWTPPEDAGYQVLEPGEAGDGYMLQVPTNAVPDEGSWTRPDGTELTEEGAYIPLPENLEPNDDGSFEVNYDNPNIAVPYLPVGTAVTGGGELQVPWPEGSTYDADAGTVQFPAGSEIPPYQYQPFIDGASQDADGNLICPCGGDTGIAPNPEDGTWSTPIAGDAAPSLEGSYPPGSATLPDGSYGYAPPEGAQYQDDGNLYLPPENLTGLEGTPGV